MDYIFQNQDREFAPKVLTRYPPGIGYTELKQVKSFTAHASNFPILH
jgi:hypothetical protein